MPTVKSSERGLPAGARYTQCQLTVPRDAIKAGNERTRVLNYVYGAIHRAALKWTDEFDKSPDWESMRVTVTFTSSSVTAEIDDALPNE